MVEPAGKSMGDEYWKPSYEAESPSSPEMGHDDESSPMYAKPAYYGVGVTKTVKKTKKVYDPGHYGHVSVHHHHGKMKCGPIVCDPQYIIRDCYIPREVPVVHPVVTVNRNIIVNVPRHYYQPMSKSVTVDPGCPTTGRKPKGI